MEAGRDGLRLSGIVLTPEHGTPLDVRYLVEAGPDGLTRRVELALDGGATRRALLADGAGSWRWEGGDGLPEVDGALDVDLTVTPATNTLPIRRLARQLETGQAADLRMAWVQFPGLEVLAWPSATSASPPTAGTSPPATSTPSCWSTRTAWCSTTAACSAPWAYRRD